MRCLLVAAEEMLSRRLSHILEANFDSRLFSPHLNDLRHRYPCRIVQARLTCDGTALLQRFSIRERTQRHPGHQGLTQLDRLRPVLLRGEQEPLDVEGDLLTFDTTDIARVDYSRLFAVLIAAGISPVDQRSLAHGTDAQPADGSVLRDVMAGGRD